VVAHRTAEKLDALVAPTLPFGMSEHHMRFPGTITLDPSTLALVVRDVIVSLSRTGFTFVIIVNGHLGNVAPMIVGLREAKSRTGVSVAFTSYWDAITDAYRSWLDAGQESWTFREFNAHGGKMEGSLSMAFDPASVHTERATWDNIARTMLAADPTLSYMSEIEDIAPSGTFGDPRGATAELGRAIAEQAAENIARQARLLREAFVATSAPVPDRPQGERSGGGGTLGSDGTELFGGSRGPSQC
jgi:creatinine amidohydrolase